MWTGINVKNWACLLADVYNTIQTYLGSSYVNDLTIYGRNFHVVAQADTNYRGDINNLNTYYVRNSEGTMVPLSAVISYKITESPALLYHFNLFRSAEINRRSKSRIQQWSGYYRL